jgi:RNA polymerase sigma-70 factor (ECF subfamily)
VEDTLRDRFREARSAWPGVSLEPNAFVARVARALEDAADAVEALQSLRASELYLTCACAEGDARAQAIFDAEFLGPVGSHVASIDPSPAFAAEVRQALREKLFLPRENKEAAVLDYAGRGSLAGWIRVAALRTALNLRRGKQSVAQGDEAMASIAAPGGDPELDYVRALCRDQFGRAMADAIGGLPPKWRNILRVHHIDGLTLDETATAFGVSRATAARWLAQSRERVLVETRRLLQERLRLGEGELESVIRVAQSRLDLSIRRYLDGPAD